MSFFDTFIDIYYAKWYDRAMIFNIHPTNQKTLNAENLQLQIFFQSTPPHPPQNEYLLRQQLHSHSYAELFACLEGQLRICDSRRREHILNSGDIAIVPSEAEHTMVPDPTSAPQWFSMGITLRKISPPNSTDLYKKAEQIFNQGELILYRHQPALCHAADECRRTQGESSAFLIFLAELLRLPPQPPQKDPFGETAPKAKNIDLLLKLDDIININFAQNFTNAEIAALLSVSTRQLSRIVEKNYGKPLRKILLKRRLQGAAELLRASDESVENIARSMGFTNKNTFFREFKKQYSCTPLAWRKRGCKKSPERKKQEK